MSGALDHVVDVADKRFPADVVSAQEDPGARDRDNAAGAGTSADLVVRDRAGVDLERLGAGIGRRPPAGASAPSRRGPCGRG
jgi:hypothetical protein